MKDGTKVLIVGLAAYLLFMRQAQADSGAGGSGSGLSGAGGSAGSGSGSSSGGNVFDLPTIGGSAPSGPALSPSTTVQTADGRTVVVVEQTCGSAGNPFVGTVIDQQSGREVGVCAGDPRIDGPTYQPLETPQAFVLA